MKVGIYYLLKHLQNHGYSDLAELIIGGILWGCVCSIPTLVLASRRKKPLAPYFWAHAVSGGIAGLCLAIPVAIGTFLYLLGESPGTTKDG